MLRSNSRTKIQDLKQAKSVDRVCYAIRGEGAKTWVSLIDLIAVLHAQNFLRVIGVIATPHPDAITATL